MNRKSIIVAVMIQILIMTTAVAGVGEKVEELIAEAKAAAPSITVDELAAAMAGDRDISIVDVRTEDEYTAGHLRNAIWIPRGKLEFLAEKKLPDTTAEIVTYCRKEPRGAMAAVTLRALGFRNVSYLAGGFAEWAESGQVIFNRHGELIVKEFEKKETPEENNEIKPE